jgi:hypothetical protein
MTAKPSHANTWVRKATEQDLPQRVELSKGLLDFHAARDPIFTRKPDSEQPREAFMRKNMAKDKARYDSRGIRRIEVRVAVTNGISTVFWRKMGFQPYLETLFSELL